MTTDRPFLPAFLNGLQRKCPRCGARALFSGYLSVFPACPQCGLNFDLYRADDAPPYFTILIVGHIVIPLMLIVEQYAAPPVWVHLVLWLPLTVILTLALLPYIKGAVMGALWSFDIKTGSAR